LGRLPAALMYKFGPVTRLHADDSMNSKGQTLFDAFSVGYQPTRRCYIANPVSWAAPCSFFLHR
jgi:hypothetical protein